MPVRVDLPEVHSLVDTAYEFLLRSIMDGSLSPGEPIPLAQVARECGTSVTPLRESLARLEGQGLVIRLPMRGFKVAAPLGNDEFGLLAEARNVLEPQLAARAARLITPAEGQQLVRAWENSEKTPVGTGFEGYREYLELSAEFHDRIAEYARNRFLRDALRALPVHLQRFRLFRTGTVNDRDVALTEHRAILDAILAHDAAGAAREMSAHIDGVSRRSAGSV
jgi:DNA-binding GntR family transcriptional regulator